MNQLDLMQQCNWWLTQQQLLWSSDDDAHISDWWLFYQLIICRIGICINNHTKTSVYLLTCCANYVFSHLTISSHTHTHPSIMLSRHRGGGSEVSPCVPSSVCRCCCHGNNGWNSRSESQVHCRFRPRPEIRSWPPRRPPLENSVSEKPAKWDSALHMKHAAFFFFLTNFNICSEPSPWHPYLRALHLKLESSCPWIILSWDRFLEYPGQNYPEGDAERRNGAGRHFGKGVYVNVYFELCQYPGRGLADKQINIDIISILWYRYFLDFRYRNIVSVVFSWF